MIVLVIMLVSGVALVRSFTASVSVAGNLGFRRDLLNQGEQGAYAVYSAFSSGAMTNLARESNQPNSNYSACQLPVDVHGVPTILSDTDTAFVGTADIATEPWTDPHCTAAPGVAVVANDLGPDANGVTVRYIVDRLCTATGAYSIQTCTTVPSTTQPAFQSTNTQYITASPYPIYRLSVRSTDARGARTYMQITFSN